MKSILDFLRSTIRRSDGTADTSGEGDTATVRKIVGALEDMEPKRARYVAAFAYLLGRVAHADLDVGRRETREMEDLVRNFGELPQAQAILVVEIAKSQNRLFGGTENYKVAREFKALSTPVERRELLDCLFAVSAADDAITGDEEAQLRQIAEELGFSHHEFVEVRSTYNDKRSVIQRLRHKSLG